MIVAVVYYFPGQSMECGIDVMEYLTRNLERFLCDRLSSAFVIATSKNLIQPIYATDSIQRNLALLQLEDTIFWINS